MPVARAALAAAALSASGLLATAGASVEPKNALNFAALVFCRTVTQTGVATAGQAATLLDYGCRCGANNPRTGPCNRGMPCDDIDMCCFVHDNDWTNIEKTIKDANGNPCNCFFQPYTTTNPTCMGAAVPSCTVVPPNDACSKACCDADLKAANCFAANWNNPLPGGYDPALVDKSDPDDCTPCVGAQSDPHFRGMDGQAYDVTGVAGSTYALLSAPGVAVNALFGTAYTTGLDAVTGRMYHPKGTWMTAVGIVTPEGNVTVSTDGTVDVKGFESSRVEGSGVVEDWPKVSVATPELSMDITFVPPPAKWGITDPSEFTAHAHFNVGMGHVAGARAHGLLGVTSARPAAAVAAVAAAAAADAAGADGEGVLEGAVSEYAVSGLLATEFKYSMFASAPGGTGEAVLGAAFD